MPRTPQPHDPNAPAHDLATQRCTHARPRPRLPLRLSPLPLLGTPQHTRTLLRSRRVRSTPYRRNAKPSSRYRSDRPHTQRLRESTRPCCRIFLFWPRNRALARKLSSSAPKGRSLMAKAQVGRFDKADTPPKRARSVPERGFVAKKWARLCQTKIAIGQIGPAARGPPRRLGSPRSVRRGPCGAPDRRGPARN